MFENDVISACEKYSGSPFLYLKEYQTRAKLYPEGELAFWIKERFEYIDKIKDCSLFGQRWINSGCFDLFEIDFIEVVSWNVEDISKQFLNKKYLKFNEDDAKKDINDFICKYLEYRVIDTKIKDLQSKEPQRDEAKKFNTTLTDPDRAKRCDELIAEAGSDIQKYKKSFIGKIDRPTLLYLLGGDCPEKIIKIQMAGAHEPVYVLLLSISDHKNRLGKPYLPTFVKKIFCPTILLDKNGKGIKRLNNKRTE